MFQYHYFDYKDEIVTGSSSHISESTSGALPKLSLSESFSCCRCFKLSSTQTIALSCILTWGSPLDPTLVDQIVQSLGCNASTLSSAEVVTEWPKGILEHRHHDVTTDVLNTINRKQKNMNDLCVKSGCLSPASREEGERSSHHLKPGAYTPHEFWGRCLD